MKKLFGLLAIMFTFVMTSFSQNQINETNFNLIVDGISSTEFLVTYNPQDQFNPMGAGVLLVHFDNPLESIDFQCDGIIGVNNMLDYYTEPKLGVGINMIRIDYHMMGAGEVNIIATSFDEDIYLATKFNAQDTLNSWNDAMIIGIEYGLKEGIASVDTDSIYLAGVNSVDTTMYINKGINSVIIPECNLDAAYLEGQMSVNMDSIDIFYNVGFADGQLKSAQTTSMKSTTLDIGLSAYPNPVDNGTDVTIDCFDFLKVDVYNISGVKMFTTESHYVSTNNLTKGVYVFVVWDRNNNTDITKIIVK